MRLHRFYISEKMLNSGGKIAGVQTELCVKSAELVNQIRRVFRLKNGDAVILFDGSGFDYECEIVGGDKDSVIFRTNSSEHSRYVPTRDVCLFAAITKKDTFEWIVEKATELGVTRIVPILAERSEKKSLNQERLNKIAIEASEQSGRGCVTEILPIKTLGEAIEYARGGGARCIAFHTESKPVSSGDLEEVGGVFIGPEGGWSPDEIDMFHNNKIPVSCLGNQVLRAETAVIVALSKVMFPN